MLTTAANKILPIFERRSDRRMKERVHGNHQREVQGTRMAIFRCEDSIRLLESRHLDTSKISETAGRLTSMTAQCC